MVGPGHLPLGLISAREFSTAPLVCEFHEDSDIAGVGSWVNNI